MGNSGSVANIAGIDDHHNQDSPPPPWTQSIPHSDSSSYHNHYQQIKVLPELNSGPRLRATNNGNILHGGGTISGRKDSTSGVYRSRSISSPHRPDALSHQRQILIQRSQTQLNMYENRPPEETGFRHFDSEPDLRGESGEEHSENKHPVKSKIVRIKKKKAPPAPQQPVLNKYDPSRYDWKTSQPLAKALPVTKPKEPARKLRLFKTKAESKKTQNQTKVATEASDHQLHGIVQNREYSGQLIDHQSESLPYQRIAQPEFDRLSDHSEWKESKVKVLPMPHQFRREKSFDLSMLLSRNRPREQSPSNDVTFPERDSNRLTRKSVIESKVRLRKIGQTTSMAPTVTTSSPHVSDFQKELLEATRRRSMMANYKSNVGVPLSMAAARSPLTDATRDVRKKDQQPYGNKFLVRETTPGGLMDEKKMSDTQHHQATKTFYFGMDSPMVPSNNSIEDLPPKIEQNIEMNVIDKFAESLLNNKRYSESGSELSESIISSGGEFEFPIQHHMPNNLDLDENMDGIQVNMRPTLPRRQFEIPRFSPAAAWRTLAQMEDQQQKYQIDRSNFTSYAIDGLDGFSPQPLEERIQRIFREPIPGFPDNKSGDSGISGDAGLPERIDSPGRHAVEKVGPFLSPWTPQQDLGEDSSSEDGGGDTVAVAIKEDLHKYSNRGHVFSLSLPRESHLENYGEKLNQEKQIFNSLQKLKRTVSGAFGNNSCSHQDKTQVYRSDNWLLSRSAPNSIDNCQFSPILNSTTELVDDPEHTDYDVPNKNADDYGDIKHMRRPRQQPTIHSTIQPPSFNYLTSGKHVMYLPNNICVEDVGELEYHGKIDDEQSKYLVGAANLRTETPLKDDVEHYRERESLQDPPDFSMNMDNNHQQHQQQQKPLKTRGHRFTFQSTVRQIERRRLAERLSKEAEQKEAQRLSELEAMRRVEEEFQKKRAREKASIRHQLRLFSMGEDNGKFSSLPVEWQSTSPRAEPDGAVASPMPSPTSPTFRSKPQVGTNTKQLNSISADYIDTKTPYVSRLIEQRSGKHGPNEIKTPTTEILSEFRTTRREYVEYRSDRKVDRKTNNLNGNQETTKHPAIVCKIPRRSTHQQANYVYDEYYVSSDNYRKDLAHGRSVCSSDSDISGPTAMSATGTGHGQLNCNRYRSRF